MGRHRSTGTSPVDAAVVRVLGFTDPSYDGVEPILANPALRAYHVTPHVVVLGTLTKIIREFLLTV